MTNPFAPPLRHRPVAARASSARSSCCSAGRSSSCSRSTGWSSRRSRRPYDVDKGPFYIPFVDFQPTLDAWHYILVELGNDTLRPYVNTVIVGLSSSRDRAASSGSIAAYALVRFTLPAAGRDDRAGHRLRSRFAFVATAARRAAGCSPSRRPSRSSRSSPRPSAGGSRRTLGNSDIAFWLISQRILPPIAVVIPLYVLFQQVGLLDSLARPDHHVRRDQPADRRLADARLLRVAAARAGGVGGGRRRVDLPDRPLDRPADLRPGLVATFLIVLIFAWNEFLIALVLTSAERPDDAAPGRRPERDPRPAVVGDVGPDPDHDRAGRRDGRSPSSATSRAGILVGALKG